MIRGLVYYYRAGRGLDGLYWVQPLNWHKDGVLENSAVTEIGIRGTRTVGCSKPVGSGGGVDEPNFRLTGAKLEPW